MSGFAEYDNYDGLGLAALIKAGEVSATEALDAALERITGLNPALNAVVHTNVERARAHAVAPDVTGPFAGVPFLLKDLMGQDAGEPCTYSSRAYASWRPDRDSELVARYKRGGVNIVGRTNTPEFGIYAVTESQLRGPCRNPWNPEHTPGGSSGGSASAVAARIVPMAHAGDGGGSIRIPASHCGLVGLKPTRGRNPMGPYAGDRWGGLVAEHIVCRSVRDSAAMLDVTQGPGLGDPYEARGPVRPYQQDAAEDPRPLRIAFTTRALLGDETHAHNIAAVQDAARLARELGHEVVEDCPTYDKEAMIRAYLIMVASGANQGVAGVKGATGRSGRRRDFEPATWLLKLIADKVTAGEYAQHVHTIQMAARGIAPFFERYDVFLTPTAARPPVPIGTFRPTFSERALMRVLAAVPARPLLLKALDKMAASALNATPNAMLFNMTGQPAVSLPLFWNDDGLPIGTQWVGPFGDEATLMQLAGQLERARPWAHRKPPMLG
ncbi:MAG: amidase [Myxococcota bacterium]|jgi:amidase